MNLYQINKRPFFIVCFFLNLDILAITSVIFSIFIYDCVMSSVINGLSYTLLLRGKYESINSFVSWGLYVCKLVSFIQYIWVYLIRIKVSSKIEMNLEPKPSSCNKLSICHWNLNSLSTHNFIKLYLLRAYISIHNFNIYAYQKLFLTQPFVETIATW